MPTTISGSTGLNLTGTGNQVTYADSSIQNTSPKTGFVNRIINGEMDIDQRYAGAAVSAATLAAGGYLVDRFQFLASQSAKFSAQQNQGSVTRPAGFANYLGLTVASAVSIGSSDYFLLRQGVEGFNISDLSWGTASASPVTLSFRVYSSLTGTFGGVLKNGAGNRSYPFTYSVPTANTWTTISITVAGDTTGTWATNNTAGIFVTWGLGVGSTLSGTAGAWASADLNSATGATSVVGTSGATFYITGVQLEKGSTATPFEFRSIGQELGLCQRYFSTSFQSGATILSTDNLQVVQTGAYFVNGASTGGATGVSYPVPMRAAPTITIYSPLTTSSAGKVRKAADGFIFTNGSASFIGTGSFQPAGGDAGNTFQYGWVATAEL
jgi:hypothetical protein